MENGEVKINKTEYTGQEAEEKRKEFLPLVVKLRNVLDSKNIADGLDGIERMSAVFADEKKIREEAFDTVQEDDRKKYIFWSALIGSSLDGKFDEGLVSIHDDIGEKAVEFVKQKIQELKDQLEEK